MSAGGRRMVLLAARPHVGLSTGLTAPQVRGLLASGRLASALGDFAGPHEVEAVMDRIAELVAKM